MPGNPGRVEDVAVLVDGAPLSNEAKAHLIEVTVDEDVSVPSLFTLRLAEADDLRKAFRWVDDDRLFAIGNGVEIRFAHAGAMAKVINGEITVLEPDFAAGERPSLTVRGYDRRHRLQRGHKTRTFLGLKDSDIAAQIAGEAGLTAQATDSGVVLDYVLQNNCTDLDLLQERAAQIGWEVVVEDKTLFFRPAGNAGSEALSLTLYEDLAEFSPRLSTAGQVGAVTVRGWDPKYKQLIKSTVDHPDSRMGGQRSGAELGTAFGAAALVEIGRSVTSPAEAEQIARGLFNRMALDLIVGEGACSGSAQLRAGRVIGLRGLGKRFSGSYYVTRAIHRFTADRGYETRFQVRRTAL
jgi:phage protein D